MTSRIAARWRSWSGEGLEHLELAVSSDGAFAESVVIVPTEEAPIAAAYRIGCDGAWRTRRVEVEILGTGRRLVLACDGAGRWSDGGGRGVAELDGATDVDLSVTPFTNTLPIRRLALVEDDTAVIAAAYVGFPDLALTLDGQRYTCLAADRLYRYEAVDRPFARDVEVDENGLVTTYPGLFRRVF